MQQLIRNAKRWGVSCALMVFLSLPLQGQEAKSPDRLTEALQKATSLDAFFQAAQTLPADTDAAKKSLLEQCKGQDESRAVLAAAVLLGAAEYQKDQALVKELTPRLQELLASKNNLVQAVASRLLAKCGVAGATKSIQAAIGESKDALTIIQLETSLFLLDPKEGSFAKTTQLLKSEEKEIRWEAALAIGSNMEVNKEVAETLRTLTREASQRGTLARYLIRAAYLKDELDKKRFTEAVPGGEASTNKYQRTLDEVCDDIAKYYVDGGDKIGREKLYLAAVRGMVDSLDPFSSYFTPDEKQRMDSEMEGKYGGIGAVVGFNRQKVFSIITPMYGQPAYKAGLRSGDMILEVDDPPETVKWKTDGKEVDEIVKRLKGKPGTTVSVMVIRKGWMKPVEFKIIRSLVEIRTVKSEMLPGKVGYVRLTQFGNNATKELTEALSSLQDQGMQGLVFDLRDNPGGLLREAVSVAEFFLKKGQLVVYSLGRNPDIAAKTTFMTHSAGMLQTMPLMVLVNGGSASASEIVSGAIRDHKRGLLVGQKTYGKGSVQQFLPLSSTNGKSFLKLTIAKYYLPSGECIHEKGIEPNIEIEPLLFDPWKIHDLQELKTSERVDNYAREIFAKNKELCTRLALNDRRDATLYPGFEEFWNGLPENFRKTLGRDDVRVLVRQEIRHLAQDEVGKEFLNDICEDVQLQRAIYELSGQIKLDLKTVEDYKDFVPDMEKHLVLEQKQAEEKKKEKEREKAAEKSGDKTEGKTENKPETEEEAPW